LIHNSGVEPRVAEYLKRPPGRDELMCLLAAMQMPVRALLRRKDTIPNQSSAAKAFMESDEAGRMKPSAYCGRVVDVV